MIETKNLIGRRKYEALKKYDFKNMSTDQMVQFREYHKGLSVAKAEKQIKDYEESRVVSTPEDIKRNQEYFKSLDAITEKKEVKLTKEILYKLFVNHFENLEGKKFNKSNIDTIENIKPLIYYFIGDLENFKKCTRVSDLSIPSLEKGLLIVGDFGNGKSSTMRALEYALKKTKHIFKGYTANELVLSYEGCNSPEEKEHFIKNMTSGVRYFDDVKTEDMSNNFGKKNLLKIILEQRYDKKLKTYMSCNFKKGLEGNLKAAILEIGEKYGDRVNDRVYEMFNIIEFKGKSFRK